MKHLCLEFLWDFLRNILEVMVEVCKAITNLRLSKS